MTQPVEVIGVSVDEAARLFGVSRSHIYRLDAKDPTFPDRRYVGGASRYDLRELREWFDAQRIKRHPQQRKERKRLVSVS
jgi:predicted DNA-binding transcriptional regulator AlpA